MFNRLFTVLLAVLFLGCSDKEIVPEAFYPRNDHEAYWYALKQANLLNTALGREWVKASQKPFEQQIEVKLPYAEAFMLTGLDPDALGYRFDVKRGQKILVDVLLISEDTTRIFLDLFRIENDSLAQFLHVASADSSLQLGFEPRKDASYLLRLQPELLRGGDFSITIDNVPTLDFPVAGKNKKAILSFFGDSRDGGKREHHGVDIFAKRHTPVIAPTDGRIRFAGKRGIGGNVIWLYDPVRGNHLYFAHLQEHKVKRHQSVSRGDTIGTVGNTGNARTTPPHLHFGIYKNGPFNPYHFIVPQYSRTSTFEPDKLLLGQNIQLAKRTFLKSEMSKKSPHLDTLDASDQIRIVAVNHQFVRVMNEDGVLGFLRKEEVPGAP